MAERPLERPGDLAVVLAEGQQPDRECLREAKSLGVNALRWTIEKLGALILAELDHIAARAAHAHQFAEPHRPPSHNPTRYRPHQLTSSGPAFRRHDPRTPVALCGRPR